MSGKWKKDPFRGPNFRKVRAAKFARLTKNGIPPACQACGRERATDAHHSASGWPDTTGERPWMRPCPLDKDVTEDDIILVCSWCHEKITMGRQLDHLGADRDKLHVAIMATMKEYGKSCDIKSPFLESPRSSYTMARPDSTCLLYTSPSPRDRQKSRMPSSA